MLSTLHRPDVCVVFVVGKQMTGAWCWFHQLRSLLRRSNSFYRWLKVWTRLTGAGACCLFLKPFRSLLSRCWWNRPRLGFSRSSKQRPLVLSGYIRVWLLSTPSCCSLHCGGARPYPRLWTGTFSLSSSRATLWHLKFACQDLSLLSAMTRSEIM